MKPKQSYTFTVREVVEYEVIAEGSSPERAARAAGRDFDASKHMTAVCERDVFLNRADGLADFSSEFTKEFDDGVAGAGFRAHDPAGRKPRKVRSMSLQEVRAGRKVVRS
jgi:hypothetical protein